MCGRGSGRSAALWCTCNRWLSDLDKFKVGQQIIQQMTSWSGKSWKWQMTRHLSFTSHNFLAIFQQINTFWCIFAPQKLRFSIFYHLTRTEWKMTALIYYVAPLTTQHTIPQHLQSNNTRHFVLSQCQVNAGQQWSSITAALNVGWHKSIYKTNFIGLKSGFWWMVINTCTDAFDTDLKIKQNMSLNNSTNRLSAHFSYLLL